MGWLDDDGYLYLGDRCTDMILTGGANVYPAEVEAAIQEHPAVRSCAVIGLPDDDLGNRVHAIVEADADARRRRPAARSCAERLVATSCRARSRWSTSPCATTPARSADPPSGDSLPEWGSARCFVAAVAESDATKATDGSGFQGAR